MTNKESWIVIPQPRGNTPPPHTHTHTHTHKKRHFAPAPTEACARHWILIYAMCMNSKLYSELLKQNLSCTTIDTLKYLWICENIILISWRLFRLYSVNARFLEMSLYSCLNSYGLKTTCIPFSRNVLHFNSLKCHVVIVIFNQLINHLINQ